MLTTCPVNRAHPLNCLQTMLQCLISIPTNFNKQTCFSFRLIYCILQSKVWLPVWTTNRTWEQLENPALLVPSYINVLLSNTPPQGIWHFNGRFFSKIREHIPGKLRQIIVCSYAQFRCCLQNKGANQRNSVLLFCTNLESSRTLLFFF